MSRGAVTLLALALAFASAPALEAQEERGGEVAPPTAGDVDSRSLPLRTALHHEPSLAAPLERLLALYREAGRTDDLLAMYRSHVAAWPQDVGARAVLVRLLLALGEEEADRVSRAAAADHPQDAYLRWLRSEVLRARNDPAALFELDRAIDLEGSAERKSAWIERLVPEAAAADRRDLAEKHLRALAGLPGLGAQHRWEVARKLLAHRFPAAAFEVLAAAAAEAPAPELAVEIDLAAAAAESALGREAEATARLDRLLGRLTADHWRRPEVVRRRLAAAQTPEDRESLLQAARERWSAAPADESAAIDLAQCLAGFSRRREALDVLREAGDRLPGSVRIEKETLELFDRLRDEGAREAWLTERMRRFPERRDLARRRMAALFRLGRWDDALAALETWIGGLEAEALAALTEGARDLRRTGQPRAAAELWSRACARAPQRLDLRREWAETLLAAGERTRARELFSSGFPPDTPPDEQIDAVRFLVQQEMLREARRALDALVERHPQDLDALLAHVDVDGRLGDRDAGERRLGQARDLADTGPRYVLWLDGAATFHERLQSGEGFFTEEAARQAREPGDWTPLRVERRLAFAEAAARAGGRADAVALLREDLAAGPPEAVRIALRRKLAGVFESQVQDAAGLQAELETLAREDAEHADEHRARLALHHRRQERVDVAMPLLRALDLRRLEDPGLLDALEEAYVAIGDGERASAALERAQEVDPTRRAGWERLLASFAQGGKEEKLRAALRRLRAGIEGLPIEDGIRTLLHGHLTDSYWRSIGARLAEGGDPSRVEALGLLDDVERVGLGDEAAIWAAWTRALLLTQLRRDDERQEAVRELERLRGSTGDGAPAPLRFPDGLTLSWARARALLERSPQPPAASAAPASRGTTPPFETAWVFECSDGHEVADLAPAGPGRVAVLSDSGRLACLGASSGKLLWEAESDAKSAAASAEWPTAARVPARLVADEEGRIFLPLAHGVEARAAADGRRLWQGRTASPAEADAMREALCGPTCVFLHGRTLVAVDHTVPRAVAFDRATGKFLRESALERPKAEADPGFFVGSGAHLSGSRLLVYGARTAVLDADTLEPAWWFEGERVRPFPARLQETPQVAAPPAASPWGGLGGGTRVVRTSRGTRVFTSGGPAFTPSPAQVRAMFQYVNRTGRAPIQAGAGTTFSLASSVGAWGNAGGDGSDALGRLVAGRLVCWSGASADLLPLDWPFGNERVTAEGAWLGASGHVACLVSGRFLTLLDVPAAKVRRIDLAVVTGDDFAAGLGGCIDGPRVVLFGSRGILAVNAATGERLFFADWPPGAGWEPPAASRAGGVNFLHPGMLSYPDGQGNLQLRAMCDFAAQERFVIRTAPGRVTALRGK